ncbi:zinc finger protein 771 [Scomber scombrus]|uniref:Zinc finger protein 771 n=1 Tax=Scomber scombrus TaxID=13677 RepID=A0AAV1N9Y7_SCOSC
MAEEISKEMTERAVVLKRSKRKHLERSCVTRSLLSGQILGNNVKTDSSFGNVCASIDTLPESTDTEILYLNPQTPKWSLVEKFAELSQLDESGLDDDQEHISRELLQCSEYTENNKTYRANEVHLDPLKKKGRNCSKYLKPRELQNDASVKQRAPKLREQNVEECTPGGAENKKKGGNDPPDKKLLKKCQDNKNARLFAAMKKRDNVEYGGQGGTCCDDSYREELSISEGASLPHPGFIDTQI